MPEIRQRALAAPQGTDLQKRQRLALLALVDIAAGDGKSANDTLLQLFQVLEGATHTEFHERWPETLAAFAALRYSATRGVGRELAFHLHLGQARNGVDSGSEAWRRHVAALAGLARYFDSAQEPTLEGFSTPPPLEQWTPVSHATARSRGAGYPRTHWQLTDEGIEKQSGHGAEFLYFQSPLAGDFEIEFDAPAFGWRDTHAMVAGEWLAARYDLKSYAHGHSRRVVSHQAVNPPFKKPQDWIHYRIVVRNGIVRYYCNGRLFRHRPVEPHADPWLAIRTDERNDGEARNVWISGKPRIPEVVQLAGTDDLAGWQQYYDTQVVGPSGSGASVNWRQRGDLAAGGGLVGRHDPHLAGSFAESLLRYHRPMLEDGMIEYEFYYRPGESHCHPALDRLAFLLDPAGVRVHWITDDRYDRTEPFRRQRFR